MYSFATSFQQPDTVSLYNLVIFIHITAAIVAFGVTFAYPILDAIVHRPSNLRYLGWWHRAQHDIGQKLIAPSATILLLAGIYLASAGPYDFGSTFVSIGIVIIVVVLGLGGAFFGPNERKAAELVQRDIDASAGGEVKLSAEYQVVARRLRIVGVFSGALVLVAAFVMVVKPL
jgi:uncharacterized membrane protein